MKSTIPSETNGGLYLGLGALATVAGAIAAYAAVPEAEGKYQPAAAAAAVVMIGCYALYLWLQKIRRFLECPMDDWLMACILTALIGGIGLGACVCSYYGELTIWAAPAPVVTVALLYIAVKRYR